MEHVAANVGSTASSKRVDTMYQPKIDSLSTSASTIVNSHADMPTSNSTIYNQQNGVPDNRPDQNIPPNYEVNNKVPQSAYPPELVSQPEPPLQQQVQSPPDVVPSSISNTSLQAPPETASTPSFTQPEVLQQTNQSQIYAQPEVLPQHQIQEQHVQPPEVLQQIPPTQLPPSQNQPPLVNNQQIQINNPAVSVVSPPQHPMHANVEPTPQHSNYGQASVSNPSISNSLSPNQVVHPVPSEQLVNRTVSAPTMVPQPNMMINQHEVVPSLPPVVSPQLSTAVASNQVTPQHVPLQQSQVQTVPPPIQNQPQLPSPQLTTPVVPVSQFLPQESPHPSIYQQQQSMQNMHIAPQPQQQTPVSVVPPPVVAAKVDTQQEAINELFGGPAQKPKLSEPKVVTATSQPVQQPMLPNQALQHVTPTIGQSNNPTSGQFNQQAVSSIQSTNTVSAFGQQLTTALESHQQAQVQDYSIPTSTMQPPVQTQAPRDQGGIIAQQNQTSMPLQPTQATHVPNLTQQPSLQDMSMMQNPNFPSNPQAILQQGVLPPQPVTPVSSVPPINQYADPSMNAAMYSQPGSYPPVPVSPSPAMTQEQQTAMMQYYQQMGYTPQQITAMMQQYQYDPTGGMQGYGNDYYSQMWYQQQQQYMHQMYYYNYWNAYNSYPSSVASSTYGDDSRPGSVIERRSSRSSDQVLSELGDLTSELSFQNRSGK